MERLQAIEYDIMDKIYNPNYLLVFDIDGVLARYQYGEYRANACPDEDWNTYIKYIDLYSKAKAPKVFKFLIVDYCKGCRCRVLSVANSQSERDQKSEFIKSNYNLYSSDIYFCENKYDKPDYLNIIERDFKEIRPNFDNDGKHIIMIDDSAEILSLIEQKTNFLTCHVSSFLE